jgi:hypothetical protein
MELRSFTLRSVVEGLDPLPGRGPLLFAFALPVVDYAGSVAAFDGFV